jgi:flagellar hook assembly protein FlgD
VTVRIFTIAGRLIQELESHHVTDVTVRVPWDGRDRDGAAIANGVYVYKIIVRSHDRSESREFIGKLAVVR